MQRSILVDSQVDKLPNKDPILEGCLVAVNNKFTQAHGALVISNRYISSISNEMNVPKLIPEHVLEEWEVIDATRTLPPPPIRVNIRFVGE